MAYLRYPHWKLDIGIPDQLIVNPDLLNENFDAIQRVINGRLGIENLSPGHVFSTAMLVKPYAEEACVVQFDSNNFAALPADARFFIGEGVSVDAVSICGASSNFAAKLRLSHSGGALFDIMTLDPPQSPFRSDYLVTDKIFASPSAFFLSTFQDQLALNVTAGTLRSMTVYFASKANLQ